MSVNLAVAPPPKKKQKNNKKKKRINEYIRDLKKGNTNNYLVRQNLETNHNFNSKKSKMFVYIHNIKKKKSWKIVEFSIISNHNTMKRKAGFFTLSLYLVKLLLKSIYKTINPNYFNYFKVIWVHRFIFT